MDEGAGVSRPFTTLPVPDLRPYARRLSPFSLRVHPRISSLNSLGFIVCSKILRETNCSYLAGVDSGDSDSFFANEIESDEEQKEGVVTMVRRPVRFDPSCAPGLAGHR